MELVWKGVASPIFSLGTPALLNPRQSRSMGSRCRIPIEETALGHAVWTSQEKAREFQLSPWSATPRDFNIYVDQIVAEK